MSVSDADIAFAKELFSDVGSITYRKMMGGATFYADGEIFAIISSNSTIYIKAKDALTDELASQGSEIFAMTRKDGSIGSMGYWTLPDKALDDPDLACDWARKALAANS